MLNLRELYVTFKEIVFKTVLSQPLLAQTDRHQKQLSEL